MLWLSQLLLSIVLCSATLVAGKLTTWRSGDGTRQATRNQTTSFASESHTHATKPRGLVNLHATKWAWPKHCWQPNGLHNMAQATFFQGQAGQGHGCKRAEIHPSNQTLPWYPLGANSGSEFRWYHHISVWLNPASKPLCHLKLISIFRVESYQAEHLESHQ